MWKLSSLMIILSAIFTSCDSARYSYRNSSAENADHFEELMKSDAVDRKNRAAEAVNLFLNEIPADENSAVLFENNSKCNLIIRISGPISYQLPVPKIAKNYVVLPKGGYQFQSKVCHSTYNSYKKLTQSITITLSGN